MEPRPLRQKAAIIGQRTPRSILLNPKTRKSMPPGAPVCEITRTLDDFEAHGMSDLMNEKLFAFILMPFDSQFDDVYRLGIKAAAEELGMIAARVDEDLA